MRIHALINYAVADLGTIQEWIDKNNHNLTSNYVYEDTNFPDTEEFDMLIILGGVMAAYEEEAYPWLAKEKSFIKEAIDADKILLGICLGSQLIAEVLGGEVNPLRDKEIGWWQIQFNQFASEEPLFSNLPKDIVMFQYHEDSFKLPKRIKNLGSSEGCKNQAFVYRDKIVGLQFHPEFSQSKLEEIIDLHGGEITEGPYSQLPEKFTENKEYFTYSRRFLFKLLDNLTNMHI